MSNRLGLVIGLVTGAALGWLAAQYFDGTPGVSAPDDWIARVGDDYIDRETFIAEMRRRGGNRPGQYHDIEQKRRLLEDLMYRAAMVESARDQGIDDQPEVARSLNQILVNQYVRKHLRPRQEAAKISDEEIRELYEAESDNYAIPARRRVAMVHIEVPDNAPEAARTSARERAEAALAAARELGDPVRDFGQVAREFSNDQASRYRGGVIGWIGEAAPNRYRHDPAVITTANDMDTPGAISGVLEGEDGFYLVRLVAYEPERKRSLEELSDGIRQRLMRKHYQQVEADFRAELLDRKQTEIRMQRLADIEPLGPPAREQRPPETPST